MRYVLDNGWERAKGAGASVEPCGDREELPAALGRT